MADHDVIAALERHLDKCEAAVTEFAAIDAQLRDQKLTPRVAEMIRVNRDTIFSMERSIELIRNRLNSARSAVETKATATVASTASAAPFAK